MPKLFYSIPDGGYIVREKSGHDVSLRNKKTGRMTGRKSVKGKGEGVGVNRVKKEFILVKPTTDRRGHTRTIREKFKPGFIAGRWN